MTHWTPLYISVGIIISLVVGAPLWRFLNRHSRKRIDNVEDDREKTRLSDQVSSLERQLSGYRTCRRDLDDAKARVGDLESDNRRHERTLREARDAAEGRIRALQSENTAKDEQYQRMEQSIRAEAGNRANEADKNHEEMQKKYQFVNQGYRALEESLDHQ